MSATPADPGLAGRVEQTAERFVPSEEADRLVAAEHWCRYRLAASLARGARVLDAGCGVGYGTTLLAEAGAANVLGVDLSPHAIEAASKGAPENARFEVADLRSIPEGDGSFDLIVCFEVIEHLAEQEQVVSELARLLAADGTLLISSPNRDVYLAGNPHHVRELTPDELVALLGNRFSGVRLLRQKAWTASLLTGDEGFTSDDPSLAIEVQSVSKLDAATPGTETFTVAIAGNGELPDPGGEVVLAEAAQLDAYMDAIKTLEGRVTAAEQTAVRAADERRAAIHERDVARIALEEAEMGIEEVQRNLDRANAALDDVTGSLSWRVTAPLRKLKSLPSLRLNSW